MGICVLGCDSEVWVCLVAVFVPSFQFRICACGTVGKEVPGGCGWRGWWPSRWVAAVMPVHSACSRGRDWPRRPRLRHYSWPYWSGLAWVSYVATLVVASYWACKAWASYVATVETGFGGRVAGWRQGVIRGTLPPPLGRPAVFAAFPQTVRLKSPDRSFTTRPYSLRVTAAVKCHLSPDREPATMKASSFSTKGWTLSS